MPKHTKKERAKKTSGKIRKLRKEGVPPKEAVAIGLKFAREKRKRS